jgi:hypothetical protein
MVGWVMDAIAAVVTWAIAHPIPAVLLSLALLGVKYSAGSLVGVLSVKGRR